MENIHWLALALVVVVVIAASVLLVPPQALPSGGSISFGGTVISQSAIDYTNDPLGHFQKLFLDQVTMNGGGNFLVAQTASPITLASKDGVTTSSSQVTVTYDLNSLYVRYPLEQTKNTISRLNVNEYQPPNTYSASDSVWSVLCKADRTASPAYESIYTPYTIGTSAAGSPVYCNQVPSSCQNNFATNCAGQTGYKQVSCTLPMSSNIFSGIFGQQTVGTGLACVKVDDVDSQNPDYRVQKPVSKNLVSSAVVTVTKVGGASESFTLASGGSANDSASGSATDVYGTMGWSVNSFNAMAPEYSNIVYVEPSPGGFGVANSFDYQGLKQTYSTIKSTAPSGSLESVMAGVTDYNTLLANTLSSSHLDKSFDVSATAAVGSLPGELRKDVSFNPPAYPVLLLYINALWVGVVNPTAVPELGAISPNPITFTSGSSAQGRFTVRNKASAQGAIQVDLPSCTPFATTQWVNNPNRNYGVGDSYDASFEVRAAQGSYTCSVSAQSGGYQTSGNYNKVSQSFSVNVAKACTQPTLPRYLDPTSSDPCHVSCPMDPLVAGRDVCADSGLKYDNASCSCQAKPDCHSSNSCPVVQACPDGTVIGACNALGQRCVVDANKNAVPQIDSSCPQPPIPLPAGAAASECMPVLQQKSTHTEGGFNLFGWVIGGTLMSSCEWNFMNIGMIVLVLGLVVLLIGYQQGNDMLRDAGAVIAAFGFIALVATWVVGNSMALLVAGLAILLIGAGVFLFRKGTIG